MRAVVLVPYRPSPVTSAKTWRWVELSLSLLGYEVITGDSPGPWSRGRSINLAAQLAGDWDCAVLADADTWHAAPTQIWSAIDRALEIDGAVVPWDVRWRLNAEASRRILSGSSCDFSLGDLDPEDGYAHNDSIKDYPLWRVGSTIVVSRKAWDAVGGFDDRFEGWGWEDCAHRMALETLSGGLERVPGVIYHLWHEMDARGNVDNAKRFRQYQQAYRKPLKMRRLIRATSHAGS